MLLSIPSYKWVFTNLSTWADMVLFMGKIQVFNLLRGITIIVVKVKGARGVMVIVVENGHRDTSSNPGRDWLHFI